MLDRGFLIDELEVAAKGSFHAGPEFTAQTHVENGVDAAVKICQAESQRVCNIDVGPMQGASRGHSDQTLQDVQWQPAEEETGGYRNDDLQGAL